MTQVFSSILAPFFLCVGVIQATEVLIGQNWESEFTDYVSAMGENFTPNGSSYYVNFFDPSQWSGDGLEFVSYVNDNYAGAYAELGVAWKQVYSQSECNLVYNVCVDISNGRYDEMLDQLASQLRKYNQLKWLVRIEYEVSQLMFAYKLKDGCTGAIDYNDSSVIDNTAYHKAFNYFANRIRNYNGLTNVKFIFHSVRGYSDTTGLYPGHSYADMIGFSLFNNDVCLPVDTTHNCDGEMIDPNLKKSIEFAQSTGLPLIVSESSVQNPIDESADTFKDFLNRVNNVVTTYDFAMWTYINQNWCKCGWPCPPWGNSRVEDNVDVKEYWKGLVTNLVN